jgi:hypothetical protein
MSDNHPSVTTDVSTLSSERSNPLGVLAIRRGKLAPVKILLGQRGRRLVFVFGN